MKKRLVIRNDDVNVYSDFIKMDEIYRIIKFHFPLVEIWSCVME